MSKIKELRTNSENNINIVDILGIFCPKGKESKYVDMLLRIMKNTKDIKSYSEEIIRHLNKEFDIDVSVFENFTPIQLVFAYRFLDTTFNKEDLTAFKNFCDYNERGLVTENDLSKYKSIDQINKSVSIAQVKLMEKEMENQIKKIHEDDEWLLLRPLTFDASKKYGSNTKWCTTSENNPDYFNKYAGSGVLIYVLNKKNGMKVACYRATNGDNEFSFWNQIDTRIDSLQSDLPMSILDVIRLEVKNNFHTNKSLLTDKLKLESNNENYFRSGSLGGALSERIANAVERETVGMEEPEPMEEVTAVTRSEEEANWGIENFVRRELSWGTDEAERCD